MADDKLDKVIKGLTECIADLDCDDCPYENECFNADDDRQYGEQMMRDALELLKEQQKLRNISDNNLGLKAKKELVRCKDCKHRGYDSCPMEPCWRKDDDWFCADGELAE